MAEEKIKWEDFVQEAAKQLLEYNIKEKEEKEYLENLASQYVVSKTKNYSLARSIVLDIHITEEFYINTIIGSLFFYGGSNFGLKVNLKEVIEEIGNIDYFKKMTVIEKLNIFSVDSIKIMKQLNNLRKAFAHGYSENHPDYKYKGKSIFHRETIDLLISDHIKNITKEAVGFIKKPDK